MSAYGFNEEIDAFSGGRISDSLPDRCEELVRNNIYRHPPFTWDLDKREEREKVIQEVSDDFIANYLFKEGNEKYQSIVEAGRKDNDVDGLMVKLFVQYISEINERKDPYRSNMIGRIKTLLKNLNASGVVTKKNIKRHVCYCKCGNELSGKIVIEEDLKKKSDEFPRWKMRWPRPGRKNLSAIISNPDLKEQVLYIFDNFTGWVERNTLFSFLCEHLKIDDVKKEIESHLMSRKSTPIDTMIDLQDRYRLLKPRQKKIYEYLLDGYELHEIEAKLGCKKTTIYDEIKKIKRTMNGEGK